MTTLPDLTLTSTLVLDRTTVLYGETGSGKSTVIVDILYLLQSYVEQVIVISPTDRQNHTYDSGLVPTPCIHYTITSQLLDDIWARQNALVSVYSRANNSSTLQSLFNRIVDNRVSRAIISDINRKLEDGRKEINAAESNTKTASSKIKDMEREYGKFTNLIYKQSINENRGYLQKLNLSKDEAFSLVYLNLNPRLVLIFDDCTEQLRRFKTHPVIQMLFYQGRWSYITAIIACHTDKALDPELKKNAYINIFTEDLCARGYFNRKSNDKAKEDIIAANSAIKAAFTPLAKHQKLVWVREEKKYYRFTAKPHDTFEFGSPYIWDYCNRIKASPDEIGGSNNKFISYFDQ